MSKLKQIFKMDNYRKLYCYLQKNGWSETYYAAKERMSDKNNECYEIETLSEEKYRKQKEQAAKLSEEAGVLFSILVPVYETKAEYMSELLDSVSNQTYPLWELILADAGKTDEVQKTVAEYLAKNPEVKDKLHYIKLEDNQGIAENSNRGLSYVKGDYVGLLDHDDTLSADALYEMAAAIERAGKDGRQPKMLYSDEDKMNGAGTKFYEPNYKEDFNLDLLLSNNYICHFLVIRTELIREMGFQPAYDGAQDYDLILRCSRKCREEGAILHIPKVLYHWRCHEQSTAVNPQSKMYAYEAGKKAVTDYCRQEGWKVRIRHSGHLGFYEVEYLHDIFKVRKDVAAVGGRRIGRGRVVTGAYKEDGTVLYENLPKQFSGYMHRAVLQQDVEAVDIRCMKIRMEAETMLQAAVKEVMKQEYANTEELVGAATEEEIRRISILFGRKVREQGYLVLYNPKMEIIVREGKADETGNGGRTKL